MSASAVIARAACLWRRADRSMRCGSVHLGRPEGKGPRTWAWPYRAESAVRPRSDRTGCDFAFGSISDAKLRGRHGGTCFDCGRGRGTAAIDRSAASTPATGAPQKPAAAAGDRHLGCGPTRDILSCPRRGLSLASRCQRVRLWFTYDACLVLFRPFAKGLATWPAQSMKS
jgi:hypothetical protein